MLELIRVQCRVIGALVLRETLTRFGRSRLGYLWAILEPVIHVATFLAVFTILGRRGHPGMPQDQFLLTGVIPWLAFSNSYTRVASALAANKPLLSFPIVSPIDLAIARLALEIGTWFVVFALLVAASFIINESSARIEEPYIVIYGIFILCAIGSGVGLIISRISMYLHSTDRLFAAIIRVIYFSSGVFFLVNEVPAGMRPVLTANPIAEAIDMIRDGFFYSYTSTVSSFLYPTCVAISLWAVGLAVDRVTRRQIALI